MDPSEGVGQILLWFWSQCSPGLQATSCSSVKCHLFCFGSKSWVLTLFLAVLKVYISRFYIHYPDNHSAQYLNYSLFFGLFTPALLIMRCVNHCWCLSTEFALLPSHQDLKCSLRTREQNCWIDEKQVWGWPEGGARGKTIKRGHRFRKCRNNRYSVFWQMCCTQLTIWPEGRAVEMTGTSSISLGSNLWGPRLSTVNLKKGKEMEMEIVT